MKTIKTTNYKESVFEGEVYTPAKENEWVNNVKRQEKKEKDIWQRGDYINFAPKRPHHVRYKGQGAVDRVPERYLRPMLMEKQRKEEIFNENIDKHSVIVPWIRNVQRIKGQNVTQKLVNYYKDVVAKGRDGFDELYRLFLATDFNNGKEVRRQLAEELGVDKITTVPKVDNPNFQMAGKTIETMGYKLAKKKQPSNEVLEKNKKPLTEEERKKVMDAGATWNFGPNGEASPAVWKSEVDGKTYYVCNTHRCRAIRNSLDASINSYDFIESTS